MSLIDLKSYGFDGRFDKQPPCNDELVPARITEVHKDSFRAVCKYGDAFARLKGTMIYESACADDYPAVGDFVMLKYSAAGDSVIHRVLPRTSKFSRKRPGPIPDEQIVAANFDYVFIMMSLNQNFNIKRMERYLTAAWQSGGIPVVILTKSDLCENAEKYITDAQSEAIGVDIYAVSSVTRDGVDALSRYLKPEKTVVFLGSSGVGKSSLINAIAGTELMKVNEIREDDARGRHTTTHRQLIMLPCGAMLIDTPGMRELGMWDVSTGLGETFSDIEELSARCRFSDCKHQSEPGCAIKEALANGTLQPEHYLNYEKLKREARFLDRKDSNKARQEQKLAMKKLTSYMTKEKW